jgi:hypothetical protein
MAQLLEQVVQAVVGMRAHQEQPILVEAVAVEDLLHQQAQAALAS